MLTVRSKILLTLAACVILMPVFGYIAGMASWGEPPAEDSYVGWIILAVIILAAVTSVMVDIFRNRVSS